MFSPDHIEALRVVSGRLTDPVIEFLLKDIARRVREAGSMTSTAAYQAWRAEWLGMGRAQVEKELARLLEISRQEARQLVRAALQYGYETTLSKRKGHFIPFEENASLQQITQTAMAMAGDDFTNLTQTKSICMMDPLKNYVPFPDAYLRCTDFAFQQVITGAADYNTAIRRACAGIAKHGVTVAYESGVRTSLEAAVRRNIMGGLGLAVEQAQQLTHDELGCDGWEISAHANSAPDHEPVQGKQYTDKEYEALNNSLVRRIGTLNCGHVASPIILGVDLPQYTPAELEKFREDNERGVEFNGKHYTGYEATQRQRQIERAIRAQKRRVLLAAPEDAETAAVRLERLNQEYRRFSHGVGLRTEDERLHMAGFGWKEGKKAYGLAEKHYQGWSRGIGANPPIKTLAKYYDVKYDDTPRYELLKSYAKSVQAGMLSPMSGFGLYEEYHRANQSELVGMMVNGTTIAGQTDHFLERVFGCMEDPKTGRPRNGTALEDVFDCLRNPVDIQPIRTNPDGKRSFLVIGHRAKVSVNPDDGMLIQANPWRC